MAAAMYEYLRGHQEDPISHYEPEPSLYENYTEYIHSLGHSEYPITDYDKEEAYEDRKKWVEDPSIFKAIQRNRYDYAIELINNGKNIRESVQGMTVMRLVTLKLGQATPGSTNESKLKEIMNLLIEKDEKGMLENAVKKYSGRRRSTRRNRRSTRRNRRSTRRNRRNRSRKH
jgi:hypothetical protein